jgi:hypothetical protein
MYAVVGITSDGEDLTAQLLIELKYFCVRVRVVHSSVEASCINLNSLTMVKYGLKYCFYYFHEWLDIHKLFLLRTWTIS